MNSHRKSRWLTTEIEGWKLGKRPWPDNSIQGTPGNYLIDREGNIVGGAIGYRDWTSPFAQKLIERLTEENSPS